MTFLLQKSFKSPYFLPIKLTCLAWHSQISTCSSITYLPFLSLFSYHISSSQPGPLIVYCSIMSKSLPCVFAYVVPPTWSSFLHFPSHICCIFPTSVYASLPSSFLFPFFPSFHVPISTQKFSEYNKLSVVTL